MGQMFFNRLFLVLLIFILAVPVNAQLQYYAPFDQADWEVRSSPYSCELVQTIPDFGEAVFFQKAGEKRIFKLNSLHNEMQSGTAKLQIRKPIWQNFKFKSHLGLVSIKKTELALELKGKRVEQLINALYAGMSPAIMQKNPASNKTVSLALSSINFRKSMGDFRACLSQLLPVNYKQIERTRISFAPGVPELDEKAKTRLGHIVRYVNEDKTVNRFYVDGHSDSEGKRLANLEFSKQRAELVSNYLIAEGVPKENIIVRYHGERYPVVKNNSAANRNINRRVTIRLEQNAAPIVVEKKETAENIISKEVAGDIEKGLQQQAAVEQSKSEG